MSPYEPEDYIKYRFEKAISTIVSSHSGSRQKFGSLFVQTGIIDKESGKLYSDLFEKRQKGDYNDFFDFDYDTVIRLIGPAKNLIHRIGELLLDD